MTGLALLLGVGWVVASALIARHYGVSAGRPVLLALVIGPLGPMLAIRNGRAHRRAVAMRRLIDAMHPLPTPHDPTPTRTTTP